METGRCFLPVRHGSEMHRSLPQATDRPVQERAGPAQSRLPLGQGMACLVTTMQRALLWPGLPGRILPGIADLTLFHGSVARIAWAG